MFFNNNGYALHSKFFNCPCCNQKRDVKNYSMSEFYNLLYFNKNLESDFIENRLSKSLEKLFEKFTHDCKDDLEYIEHCKKDIKDVIYCLSSIFNKGYNSNFKIHYSSLDTIVRDRIFDFVIDFISRYNGKIVCINCIKTKEKKKKENLSFDISKVYSFTDNKLGSDSLVRISDKLKYVKHNGFDLNKLVKVNERNIPISLGNRPYHLIFSLNDSRLLHVTPYCVWYENSSNEIDIAYKELTKASNMTDLIRALERRETLRLPVEVIEFISDLYNGRKRVSCLVK